MKLDDLDIQFEFTINYKKFVNKAFKYHPMYKIHFHNYKTKLAKNNYMLGGLNVRDYNLIYINTDYILQTPFTFPQIVSHEVIENIIDRILRSEKYKIDMEAWHIFAFDLSDQGYMG